ncbi:MAG: rRNA maturation RNase YbeY [Patescibacteria group bacterium]|nr:rRNA maturation RNase YbeY [Patescibacteria group bacterium]
MIEINNKTKSKIDLALVQKVAQKFLKYYNKERRLAAAPFGNGYHANINKVELSIAFVGDKIIRRLNKTYRGIDKATDVLAFPCAAAGTSIGEQMFLGEILINYSQVKRQAKKFGNSAKRELVFILVHGLLHLLGHDDKTETGRREMERIGEEFVKNF